MFDGRLVVFRDEFEAGQWNRRNMKYFLEE